MLVTGKLFRIFASFFYLYLGYLKKQVGGAIDMKRILIDVGQQGNGCVFALSFKTRDKLKKELAESKRFKRVYVGYERGKEPEELVGAMSQQIVTLLTGFPEPTIEKLGGFAFRNPVTGEEIFQRKAKNGKTG